MPPLDFLPLLLGAGLGVTLAYFYFRGHVPADALRTAAAEKQRLTALAEQHRREAARLAADLDDAKHAVSDISAKSESVRRAAQEAQQAASVDRARLQQLQQQRREEGETLRQNLHDGEVLRQRLAVQLEEQRELATRHHARVAALEERLIEQRAAFTEMQQHAREEFVNLSHRMLKSGSADLRAAHEQGLRQLLDPVKENLKAFRQTVEQKFVAEGKEKTALGEQIRQLTSLNQDLSQEAKQLTKALKGDAKTQGDWGEHRLERLLEAAGLQAGMHYDTQTSFRDGEHYRQQRPDCIVKLPQGRHIVIDAKVSLTAYERFCGSDTDEKSRRHLGEHVQSIRAHIKGLSAKRYQDLTQLDTPDYVLLFVPLEPAFIAAVRERGSLFTEALDAKIVLVCPSTLLATMRTVSHIWQQDDQRTNALAIAEVGKKLYNKFVGFVEDMDTVGRELRQAQTAYDQAMKKLSRSPKQGTTLVAQANKLRALGVDGKTLLAEGAHATQ